jgi:type IV pilus assembly protein PilA
MERLRKKLIGRKGGFTLIELLMVVAIIGILSAIALPVMANVQARARLGRAQADVRTIASAIMAYQAHCGVLPPAGASQNACGTMVGAGALTDAPLSLTAAQLNAQGQTAGPFLAANPTVPQGWTGGPTPTRYGYIVQLGGTYVVCAVSAADGTGANTDGSLTCAGAAP